jgi:adenylate cyclase
VATEIERKFLVTGEGWRQPEPLRICQGYLNRDADRTVRVRIAGERAYLTIKGRAQGLARPEFEYEIPVTDAEQLLKLCEGPILEKHRHVLVHAGSQWEVDEFHGDNQGLVVAEIELEREDQPFECPQWLHTEVTDDPRYLNSNLSRQPYRTWSKR